MQRAAVQTIAETVVLRELGGRSVDHVEVREDVDHAGEPSIFVEAFLPRASERIGGEASTRVLGALSYALRQAGESRFPYFRVRYLDDERPDDEPARMEH